MGEARDPEEFFDVAERIIQNINAVFERDSSLDEFDIVPVESQSNRSPVIHINHKLALESWCVPFLYSHSFKCFSQLLPKRNYNKHRQHHITHPQQYQNGSSLSSSVANILHNFDTNLTAEDKLKRKLYLSRVLVLLNPDLTVAWNFRREAYSQDLTTFQDELSFASVVASRKPKSSEGFSYRKWLLRKLFSSNQPEKLPAETLYEIFALEIQAVEKAASSYFSNYHAWNYRMWLLDTFSNLNQHTPPTSTTSSSQSEQQRPFLLQMGMSLKYQISSSEKKLSDEWIEKHISDHSGFHYRQRLLIQLCQNEFSFERKLQILKKELDSNLDFITRFPGHETLWCHRRFLLHFIVPKLQLLQLEHSHRRGKVGGSVNFENSPDPLPSCTQMDIDDENDQDHDGIQAAGNGTDESGIEVDEEIKYLKSVEENLVKSFYLAHANLDLTPDDAGINYITKDSSRLDGMYSQRHAKWLFLIFEWISDSNI